MIGRGCQGQFFPAWFVRLSRYDADNARGLVVSSRISSVFIARPATWNHQTY